uniref:Uncharacterized protein n=1 Tax=Setaria italica TaxID=4555 RepID=K3Y0T0_SETIT
MKALRNCSKTNQLQSRENKTRVSLVCLDSMYKHFFSSMPFCWYLVAPYCGFYSRILY